MSATGKQYGVGVLGNCCTHGEFVVAALRQEPNARLIAGWEGEEGRQSGLSAALEMPLATSPEALLEDPAIDIIALACSPHEKAGWVEKAVQAGKHIFLNKPLAESLTSARRIKKVLAGGNIQFVYDIPEFLEGYQPLTPFQQLTQAIETSTTPDSSIESAALGVEILMAAYQSIQTGGASIPLPLQEGDNPLTRG